MIQPSPVFCDSCGAANRSQARFCIVCGTSLRSATAGPISRTLTGLLAQRHVLKGRYVILGQAGRGGFGAVYKAADTQLGNRLVAIKEMSQSNLKPQELLTATEAFKREALLLADLRHQNLPGIYEQFTDTGRSYLVMEFIEGQTLEDILSKLRGQTPPQMLPIEKVLAIGIQLCEVLDYLHTRQPPIIFRDLKPANVMLTSSEHVYLIDFGIARHFKQGQTKDTAALGSSGYAPPEQYGKAQTTARADIYSLGATLHQLLTGHDPTDSPFQFAPLEFKNLPFLAGLDTLVMSMVSIDINKRPSSAAAVKQELQRIVTNLTVHQTIPLKYGATNAYQALSVPTPKPTKAARGVKAATQVRPQVNTLYVCCGHTSRVTAVAWSPDGKYFASASYDKTVRIWESTNGNHMLTCKGHFGRVQALAWSPDSKRLVSASDDGTVRVWDAATGKLLITYSGHTGQVRAVAWSLDGVHIASAGSDAIVQVWNANTGTVLSTYRDHMSPVHAVAWSPDGKWIVSGGEDKAVHMWEPVKVKASPKRGFLGTLTLRLSSDRRPARLQGHSGRIHALAWSSDSRRIAAATSSYQTVVWEVPTGTLVFSQTINGASINTVAWSPDGKHLAFGGNDKAVQIWNMVSKKLTFPYRGHAGYILAVAWSPDGTRIASGSVDHTVQVWKAL
jgi:WD40 repeat protein